MFAVRDSARGPDYYSDMNSIDHHPGAPRSLPAGVSNLIALAGSRAGSHRGEGQGLPCTRLHGHLDDHRVLPGRVLVLEPSRLDLRHGRVGLRRRVRDRGAIKDATADSSHTEDRFTW